VSGKGVRGYMPPSGYRVYFNGRDVHCEASECDLEAGWVRLYRTTGERNKWGGPVLATPPRQYVARGKVELRRAPSQATPVASELEKIPPLLVRISETLKELQH
jgi:hypothetical protein